MQIYKLYIEEITVLRLFILWLSVRPATPAAPAKRKKYKPVLTWLPAVDVWAGARQCLNGLFVSAAGAQRLILFFHLLLKCLSGRRFSAAHLKGIFLALELCGRNTNRFCTNGFIVATVALER